MIYGIAHEKGICRVYRLLDANKADTERNRRYIGSFDREDRAREYLDALRTMPEPEVKDEIQ